jgi:hypothetical protein
MHHATSSATHVSPAALSAASRPPADRVRAYRAHARALLDADPADLVLTPTTTVDGGRVVSGPLAYDRRIWAVVFAAHDLLSDGLHRPAPTVPTVLERLDPTRATGPDLARAIADAARWEYGPRAGWIADQLKTGRLIRAVRRLDELLG